ncbi:MAG: GNAT family N-acetyltransferase [Acidimicrobiia bacterium]|nr:GNAT family N-acetyltransferase [Acidimicrobiia bacterium]
MRLHDDWSSAALDREPIAADVGPFPRRGFLEAWWAHRGSGDVLLAEHGEILLPLYRGPAGIEIIGDQDLTDYHCPLGGTPADLAEFGGALAEALPPGTPFRLDSLPQEVAVPLAAGLSAAGVAAACHRHEAAAVLELSGDREAYLAGLRSKDRHEIRRKRRRFAETAGPPELIAGPGGFGSFVTMHRAAGGRKGDFMDDAMVAFFEDLLGLDGAVLSLLMGGDTPVAAAFGFQDEGAYYLYNSAYDPEFGAAAPGVTLVDLLIGAAADGGRRRFDFLKGDESYKFRMGATARPLYAIEGAA